MNRVVELVGPRGQSVILVGGILGLAVDESLARNVFMDAKPEEVLLGVPYEDLDAIRATSGKEASSEFESGEIDDDYLRRLKAFGEVRSPPPDLYALFRLAEENKIPVRAIDLGDEAYTEAYTQNVGMFEVLRSNRNQRKLPSVDIQAPTAEEFAMRWDEAVYPSKGLRKLQDLREDEMSSCIEKTLPKRLLALVPLARMNGVAARLTRAGWKPSTSSAYQS
jgi:hypothetical protein